MVKMIASNKKKRKEDGLNDFIIKVNTLQNIISILGYYLIFYYL